MPVLKDQREETFCRHVASGATGVKAAQLAGYSEKSARSRASKLLRRDNIVARVAELKQQIAAQETVVAAADLLADAIVDRAYVIAGLKEVAERCRQARAVRDKKGNPVLIETPSGELAAAYVFDSTGANKALELLGKTMEVGLFTVDPKDRRPGDLKELTNDQLDRLIARLATELSAEELAAFGLERTGRTVEGEPARSLPSLPEAG